MGIVQGAIGSFLIAFPALFSIVNPPGGALIYHQVTADREHTERVRLAWRVALWAGAAVIGLLGVTLAALRIAGGLVVAARAWELLSAPQQQEDRKQAQAAPAAGAEDVTFFPLTVPFTTGPGTIAVAIALGANRPTGALDLLPYFAGGSLAAAAVAATVGLCYAAADRVVALFGPAGARVLRA
jgi:multiple antibiotic resistance protein